MEALTGEQRRRLGRALGEDVDANVDALFVPRVSADQPVAA